MPSVHMHDANEDIVLHNDCKRMPAQQAHLYRRQLCAAALGGHLDAVKVLVENGAEVNRPGKSGDTPYALARRHKEVREWLVANGAVAEGRKNKLDVGKFASLSLQLGAGPSQHVAESRDKGNLTSEVRGEQLKKHHAVCEACEAKGRSKREGGLKCDACGKHRARKKFSVKEEEKRGRKKCKVHETQQE